MAILVYALVFVSFANAVIAFGIFFFWQSKVISTMFKISEGHISYVPWKALADPKSPQNNFSRLLAGEIFPELRKKWLKALAYVVASYAMLFSIVGLLMIFARDYLP
ncbi:hypothetical protein [Celeribacter sp. PS-C1]|uniref:hypothetical protein n=1 Tax=Celeribacter sp. PS-C1 TaxID=2820813 RepID=UPI001CA51BD5|nr:hypothetical protein [Celeribacter sp. PS-C1]MBW6417711.1 hypothetical protein [Celeribacter sp. PS-C1]